MEELLLSGEAAEEIANTVLEAASGNTTDAIVGSLGAGVATGTVFGGFLGFIIGFGVAAVIVWAIWTILSIIGTWKMFTKAGEAGWKSIIPIYGSVILWRIGGRSFGKFFLITCALSLLSGFLGGEGTTAGSIAMCVCLIYFMYEDIMLSIKLAKNFGKGNGFAAGLFLLPPLFFMILGFGSSEYNKVEE